MDTFYNKIGTIFYIGGDLIKICFSNEYEKWNFDWGLFQFADSWVTEPKELFSDIKSLVDDMAKAGFVPVTELRLLDEKKKLGGIVDLVFVNPKTKQFYVYDYKTRNKYNNVTDSSRGLKYVQQLSAYANLIEKMYGLKFAGDASIITVPIDINFDSIGNEFNSNIERPSYTNYKTSSMWASENQTIAYMMGNSPIGSRMSKKKQQNIDQAITDIKNSLLNVIKSSNSAINQDSRKVSQDLLDRIDSLDEIETINAYLTDVEIELGELDNKFDEVNHRSLLVSAKDIRTLQLRYESLKTVSGVIDLLNKELLNIPEGDEQHTVIKELIDKATPLAGIIKANHESLKTDAIEKMAYMMASLSNLELISAKEELFAKFEEENPPVSKLKRHLFHLNGEVVKKNEWMNARDRYAFEHLNKSNEAIISDSLDWWMNYLRDGYYDVDGFLSFAQDAGKTRSILIQTVNAYIEDREQDMRIKHRERSIDFLNNIRKYAEEQGLTLKQLHGDLVDVDEEGLPTGMIVSKYKNSFLKEYLDVQKEYATAVKENKSKAEISKTKKAYSDFMKKNIKNGVPLNKHKNKRYDKHAEFLEKVLPDSDKNFYKNSFDLVLEWIISKRDKK